MPAVKRSTLDVGGIGIAVNHAAGASPGIVWLGGFGSDMAGTKAVRLEEIALRNGWMSTRFDYSGHGESGGSFRDGTISGWTREAASVLDACAPGRQILVGSSMGAWIALRLVKALNTGNADDRIAGLLLLAPAPDFTSQLMEPALTDRQRADLEEKGFYAEPTPYGPEPNIFTRALFEDGRAASVMTGPIDTHCPVFIIQGKADPDVPWQHAQKLYELLSNDDATITYIEDGDHRLSRPGDLDIIERQVTLLHDAAG